VHDFIGTPKSGRLIRGELPGLGILSNPDLRVLRRGRELVTTTPEIRDFLMRPEPLIVTKASLRSRVHRRVYMDYVGIKRYGAKGQLAGELRLVGLFTSTAYTQSVRRIPYLRRKVAQVLASAGYGPTSFSGKALVNILEWYPRDDLFQIDVE